MGVSYPDSDLLAINPANVKDELFWAWRQFLTMWARLSPLIVVVEDIQWADKVVLDLLQSVVNSLEGAPILFLSISRPELLEQWPDWMEGNNRTLVQLQPLTSEESLQLFDTLLAPNLLSPPWKDRVLAAAGGIPYYLEEFIRTLVEEGRVVQGPAGWTPVQSEQLPDLPDTFYATVSARLDRLPSIEKTVLQRAAVVGNSFWESALSYPAPQLGTETTALEGLSARGWIRDVPDSPFVGDRELAFTNELARESAYKGLTRTRLTREHLRVAEWLENKAPDRVGEFVELLAYHFGQGTLQSFEDDSDDPQTFIKAATYGWQAGERARLQQAYMDALSRYDDTKALLSRLAGFQKNGDLTIEGRSLHELELELLLLRASVKEPLGQYDSALEDLNATLAQAASPPLTSVEARAYALKSRVLRLQTKPAEAIRCAERAIALYELVQDKSGQAQALLTLGELHSDQAKLSDYEMTCRKATQLGREAEVRWVEARGLTLLGSACIYQGKMEEAQAHLKAAVELYQALSDRHGLASSLLVLGRVLHAGGSSAEAIERIEQAFAVFQELGDQPMRVASLTTLGQLHLERGNIEDARSYSEKGVALAKMLGQAAQQLRCLLLLCPGGARRRPCPGCHRALTRSERDL